MNPGEMVFTVKQAYRECDLATLQMTMPRLIEFIQDAIKDCPTEVKIYANGAIRGLRLVNQNLENGVVGVHDEECFVEAVRYLATNIILPRVAKENPEAVKKVGLWGYVK